MPLPMSKHVNAERAFYPAFDGGLNLSVPNESLAKNELKEALNVEFSPLTGSLRVRGGLVWSGRFNGVISDVVPVFGRNGFLARQINTKKVFYFTSNCLWNVQGNLSGDGRLSAAAWGDDGVHVVASGGKLQLFTPSNENGFPAITTISASPSDCKLVFVRDGRVGVVTGDDTIKFSAVGDVTSWANDPTDASTGQFVEIGYKDGMDITAVVPLSRDLIIFKNPPNEPEKGTVWRLTGNSPEEWTVLEVAHNTGTFSQKSVQAVANDVFYLSPHGVATLSGVTAYGEVKSQWPDRKVSNVLTGTLQSSGQLWNVPEKQQLWVLPSDNSEMIWVLDYMRGIWTQIKFPKIPVYVYGLAKNLYVFIGQDLYCLSEYYTQDELYKQTPTAINAKMRMGAILRGRQTLIKSAFASFSTDSDVEAYLKIGGFKMPLVAGGTPYYIYDNTDKIYGNERPILTEAGVLTARRRCLVRDWTITPEITAVGGFALSTMGFEIAEV